MSENCAIRNISAIGDTHIRKLQAYQHSVIKQSEYFIHYKSLCIELSEVFYLYFQTIYLYRT